MKKIIYALIIYIVMTNKFAICATRRGVFRLEQDDLPPHVVAVPVNSSVVQHYARAERVETVVEAQAIPMGQTIDNFIHERMQEIVQEFRVIAVNRSVRNADRDYILSRLNEIAGIVRAAYGKPGDELMQVVQNIRELQVIEARYPNCAQLREVCNRLRSDELDEFCRILQRFQVDYWS